MDGIIVVCLLVIIFLLWKNNEKIISSNSNEWMILVWYKEFIDFDSDGNVKDTKIIDGINIMFVPIIGWKYNGWSHKYGKLTPITPPYYRVKDRLERKDGEVRMSYYVRDGEVYNISSEWIGDDNFWGNLNHWSFQGIDISFSNIPDSLENKVQENLKKR